MEVEKEVEITIEVTCPYCDEYFDWTQDVLITLEVEHDDFP